MHNGVASISRCEQHLDFWPHLARYVCELTAVHSAGKTHVRKQQYDLGMLLKNLQRRAAIARLENRIAEFTNDARRVSPNIFLVLYHQNGLAECSLRDLQQRIFWPVFGLVRMQSRQIDLDSRSLAELAVDFNVAARLLHKAIDL